MPPSVALLYKYMPPYRFTVPRNVKLWCSKPNLVRRVSPSKALWDQLSFACRTPQHHKGSSNTRSKANDQRDGLELLVEFLLRLALHRLSANLLVVLLQGSQVLTGLGELALLHTLTDVPVHEGTLGVHQVELVVQA